MGIRVKVLLVNTIAIVLFSLSFFIFSQILTGYIQNKYENRSLYESIEGSFDLLTTIQSENRRVIYDWANWDDAHDLFVKKNIKEFIEKNLYDNAFIELDISLMSYVDFEGNVILSKGYDQDTGSELVVDKSEISEIVKSYDKAKLSTNYVFDNYKFKNLPTMTIYIAEVKDSKGKEKSSGYVVIGRKLQSDILKLKKLKDRKIEFIEEKFVKPENYSKANGSDDAFVNSDNSQFVGIKIIKDRKKTELGYIKIQKDIANSTINKILLYVSTFILFLGVVYWFVIKLFVDKYLISRLLRLNDSVKNIKTSKEKVPVEGEDEISELAENINSLLQMLEDNQSSVKKSNSIISATTFASGIAHEVNNPLAIINGYIAILEKEGIGKSHNEYIKKMKDAVNRIKKLAGSLKTYCGTDLDVVEPYSVHLAIDEAISYIEFMFKGEQIDLVKKFNFDEMYVKGSKIRFQQAIMGVFQNMRNQFNMHVDINNKNIEIKTSSVNNYAVIEITNLGFILENAEIQKIKSPFLVIDSETNSQGISMARAIVESQNGLFEIISNSQKGCVVTLHLPIIMEKKEEASLDN